MRTQKWVSYATAQRRAWKARGNSTSGLMEAYEDDYFFYFSVFSIDVTTVLCHMYVETINMLFLSIVLKCQEEISILVFWGWSIELAHWLAGFCFQEAAHGIVGQRTLVQRTRRHTGVFCRSHEIMSQKRAVRPEGPTEIRGRCILVKWKKRHWMKCLWSNSPEKPIVCYFKLYPWLIPTQRATSERKAKLPVLDFPLLNNMRNVLYFCETWFGRSMHWKGSLQNVITTTEWHITAHEILGNDISKLSKGQNQH